MDNKPRMTAGETSSNLSEIPIDRHVNLDGLGTKNDCAVEISSNLPELHTDTEIHDTQCHDTVNYGLESRGTRNEE